MSIDVRSLSKDERKKLVEEIQKAEQEEKEAYKYEFLNSVVEIAIERGVKWSEALALLNVYTPDSDMTARKLGYKYKAKNSQDKTVYYMRKMSGAKEI